MKVGQKLLKLDLRIMNEPFVKVSFYLREFLKIKPFLKKEKTLEKMFL
jgi:hypothetical protein